jgi:hypothetical protein
MKAEQLQLALRPRRAFEAVDLGVRMTQRGRRSLVRAYLPIALLLVVACGATMEIAPWLPSLLLWWCEPWLDRTLLDIYARQAFGEETRFRDAWEARRRAPWWPMIERLTYLRISFWRAYSTPVTQLEGQTGAARRKRASAIVRSHWGAALLLQATFFLIELFLIVGMFALFPLLTPGLHFRGAPWVFTQSLAANCMLFAIQAIAVLFIEPYYVASGFAMYLNRRVELEAWDVEQGLRHAFAAR